MAISRFIVMATLQAARASVLGLKRDRAYSWGLQRAIFYAAAKQGFRPRGYPAKRGAPTTTPRNEEPEAPSFKLGDELAFTENADDESLFVIGGTVQTPEAFERQIVKRFGGKFEEAWNEAIKIVENEDEETLLSQRKFYEDVYKPRRDTLSKKWSEMSSGENAKEKTSTIHKTRIKVKTV
jgi:hypothetical protein